MLYDFGPRLASLRKKAGLTQQMLVARAKAEDPHLHLTDSVLGKYENDKTIPRLAEAAAIADVLGVSLDHLANGEKCQNLSVKGLTEDQIRLMGSLVAALRKMNSGESRAPFEAGSTAEQAKLLAYMAERLLQ